LLPSDSLAGATGDFNNDGKLDLVSGLLSNMRVYLLQETPLPSFSPLSVAFADQAVGTTSPPQKVTLTNSGTGPLTISSIGITGGNPRDFSQTNNCPASLAVGANCQISVTFTPMILAVLSASLTVTDNAPGSPQSVPLSGTGARPLVQLSPSSVKFSTPTAGEYKLTAGFDALQWGDSALTITSIGITGANAGDFPDTSTCGTTLGATSCCQNQSKFTPTTSGTQDAALAVSGNAPGSPQAVALSGTGQDFSLAPVAPGNRERRAGADRNIHTGRDPRWSFNQTVDLSCSGAPTQSRCSVSNSLTLDGVNPSMATVSVVANASAMGLTQPANAPTGSLAGSVRHSGTVYTGDSP
jgi:hypothetical protein